MKKVTPFSAQVDKLKDAAQQLKSAAEAMRDAVAKIEDNRKRTDLNTDAILEHETSIKSLELRYSELLKFVRDLLRQQ